MPRFQAKTSSGIATTLFLALLLPTAANAADFLFGAHEQVVYSTSFQNANGLVFENGTTANSLPIPGGIGIVNSVVNGEAVNELHGFSCCLQSQVLACHF